MADGKLYRLITVGLWAGFCLSLFWSLFLLGVVIGDTASTVSFILESATGDIWLENVRLNLGVMFWLYPLMLVVQYIAEGQIKWFPWNR